MAAAPAHAKAHRLTKLPSDTGFVVMGGVGAGVWLSLHPVSPAANARPTAREAERRRRTGRGWLGRTIREASGELNGAATRAPAAPAPPPGRTALRSRRREAVPQRGSERSSVGEQSPALHQDPREGLTAPGEGRPPAPAGGARMAP
jgi:hypothetical protein